MKVTADKGTIYSGADAKTRPVEIVMKGEKFKVIDKIENWYAVSLSKPVKGMESGWLKATQVVPEISPISTTPPEKSISELMYEKIVASVKALKDGYANNPYVTVKGFNVNISVPPSVSISFEFK
ncbi:MAG: hypothetical protein FJ117_23830 [Deltaproteobacteria bacterium]|nr:hypothetical protein [Deltaproteobacteria bacterium]